MSKGKTHLGLISVCVTVALGMMVFAAASAQAAHVWMVNGANVAGVLEVETNLTIEPLGAANEKHLVLLTTAAGAALLILCSEVKLIGKATFEAAVIKGEADFTNCETFLNSTMELSAVCKPEEPIKVGAEIRIALHEGGTYAVAKGLIVNGRGEKVFTEVTLGVGFCAIGVGFEVTGDFWIEDCENLFTTENVAHLIQEAMGPALALKSTLKNLHFGKEEASIDGSLIVKLAGAHLGMDFSGL